jgi:hypothetical protein
MTGATNDNSWAIVPCLFSAVVWHAARPNVCIYFGYRHRSPLCAAVADTNLTATDPGTGAVRSAKSNATGFYTIPGLTPGNYSVNVEKEGFHTTESKSVPLTVAQTRVSGPIGAGGGVTTYRGKWRLSSPD